MNHQPTQLALLISLIGLGVAPHANASASASASIAARLDERAIDASQPLPGVSCDELGAAVSPACGANPELTWLAPRDALGRTATAGVRVLYTTARDDWAPGEVADEAAAPLGRWIPREGFQPPAAKPIGARELPRQTNRKSAGKAGGKFAGKQIDKQADKPTRTVRVLAPAPAAARMKAQAFERADVALERIERIATVEPTLPVAQVGAESADGERQPQTVDAQSSKVLRQLGAILSEERDEVGAVLPQDSEAVIVSQAGKVMNMLGEIVAAPLPVEDGPARRLRKLAARAAKADAMTADTKIDPEAGAVPDTKAAADLAGLALAAEIARDGVDLMLPLEPPTFAAEPAPRSARASPFGDRRVALAETSLDRVRGGFSAEGLNISFGIERAVYVNGALVTTTSLNVSDLGRITAGRGAASFDVGAIGLIQSGAGNVVSPTAISAGSIGTVVQNTLDGQKIQNVTIINATSNSLGLLKGINLQSSLRGAVIDSLRR